MNLIDGIKLQGSPAIIPNCSRDDLPDFFLQMGYKVGVEIGVYKAEFTEKFCKAGFQMYAVDPYLAYKEYIAGTQRQEREDFLYGHASRVLAPYPNCQLIRKTSMDATKDFEDESLDFVYIDGNHGFKYVAEDLWEWSKKVKKGGAISGHDYGHTRRPGIDPFCFHVQCAVEGYTKALDIKNWYVLGTEYRVKGQKRDRWRSFLWLKP